MKSALSTVVLVLVFMGCQVINAQKVILDADTANEMDDFYAIVKAIIDPEIDLIAFELGSFQQHADAVGRKLVWKSAENTQLR